MIGSGSIRASRAVGAGLAGLLAATIASGGTARASGEEIATAQVLFDDARHLMAQQRWSEACPKLKESQRLAPAIGTEFNLADCWEHAGHLASAWAAFLEVVDQTHTRGEASREAAARSRAQAIAARLGTLAIQVPVRAAGLEVLRDGQPVPAEVWGVGVPVDAGDHRIEARAPGRVAWTSTVRTADGAAAATAVPDLAQAAAAPAADAVPASPPPALPPPPEARVAPGSVDHTASLIVLGSAVVLAGVGLAGILESGSNISAYNADAACPGIAAPSRPAQCNDYVNAASTWNTVGVVGFVGSGLALVAGVTLWLLAPTRPATAAGTFACAPGPATLACAGRF